MLKNPLLPRFIILCACLAALGLSGSCGCGTETAEEQFLSADEQYLVDTYVEITAARRVYIHDPIQADSLFALIDSTADADRITNTITLLNSNPDRWIVVFSAIEQALKNHPPGER